MIEPLSSLVRTGKLASPIRRDFDRMRWVEALAEQPSSPETQRFYVTMNWFADQLAVVHSGIAALKLERLDREALIREFSGRCNYAYVHSEARLRQEIAQAEPGTLPMGSPAHVLFTTHTGDSGNADAWRTGATDTLGAALRYVIANCSPQTGPAFGIAKAAETAFALFNQLYVLEFYCDKAIWQGWNVQRDEEAWRIAPPEPDMFGRSAIAVDWRRDQEHGEWSIVTGTAWRNGRGFGEWIVERDTRSGKLTPQFQMPGNGQIPQQSVLRWTITASDLTDVADKPLPGFPGQKVTLNDLVDATLLIGSAARVLMNELLEGGPMPAFKQFAPALSQAELDALLVCLGWSASKRDAVMAFFSYKGPALDGVWSKPLVATRRGFVPIFPAIIGPNLYRSAELWLSEADGETLQRERGSTFEARVRDEIRKALAETGADGAVQVAPPFTVKIDGSRRDVDLALRMGNTVFIGEDKLKRFPAMPRESGRWIDELAKGADQARLRSGHFAKTPQSIAKHLGFTGDSRTLRFVPFVLASGSFGAGTVINGVPVIDFDSFKEFFDPGYFGAMGEITANGDLIAHKTVAFRDDSLDLAACFEAYLQNPLRVRVIEWAMVPRARTIGMIAIDGRMILCTDPMVDYRRFINSAGDELHVAAEQIWRDALALIRDQSRS